MFISSVMFVHKILTFCACLAARSFSVLLSLSASTVNMNNKQYSFFLLVLLPLVLPEILFVQIMWLVKRHRKLFWLCFPVKLPDFEIAWYWCLLLVFSLPVWQDFFQNRKGQFLGFFHWLCLLWTYLFYLIRSLLYSIAVS